MFNNFEKPKVKAKTEQSLFEKIKNKIPDPKVVAATLMLMSNSPSSGQNPERNLENPDHKIEMTQNKDGVGSENILDKIKTYTPTGDIYFRFDKENDDGTVTFNPWSIIAPLQVELGYKVPQENTVTLNLPYKYSRLFNTAEIANPEDKEQMIAYIDSALKAELAQSLYFLDFSNNSREVYKAFHNEHGDNLLDDFSNNEVKSIEITGFTSPEGPAHEGPSSLKPDNVNQENTVLGEKRAANVDTVLREQLQKMGIKTDTIIDLKAEELQFDEAELTRLEILADQNGIKGSDQLTKIFSLIKSYNSGALKNSPELENELDLIIASKRTVAVTIKFVSEQEKRVILPLPLTLLLLLAIPYLKRKPDPEPRQPLAKREIFSEKEIDNDPEKLEKADKTKFDEWYLKADEETSIRDREVMKKKMFVDEITRYIDDKQSIYMGLDYRAQIENIGKRLKAYPGGREQLEIDVAKRLLFIWQDYDRAVRRQNLYLSRSTDVAENILDYDQDPKKIAWAKIAAKQLIEAAEVFNNNPRGFDDELQRKAFEMSKL